MWWRQKKELITTKYIVTIPIYSWIELTQLNKSVNVPAPFKLQRGWLWYASWFPFVLLVEISRIVKNVFNSNFLCWWLGCSWHFRSYRRCCIILKMFCHYSYLNLILLQWNSTISTSQNEYFMARLIKLILVISLASFSHAFYHLFVCFHY